MRTTKARLNGRKLSVICAVLATIFAQTGQTSVTVTPTPPSPVSSKADLSAQARTLDSFVNDLFKLDKRSGEFSKRGSLTRADFDSLKSSADDLKRRLSEVQNALRAIITKLKDAGEWNDIDSRVAESISDAGTRARFNQTSFKRELEDLAANLTNSGDEISSPLENLRRRVSARNPDSLFGSALGWQSVPVAYHPEPAMGGGGIKCGLSKLRYGISKLTHGAATAGAHEAYHCACNIPSGYSCYSPPAT